MDSLPQVNEAYAEFFTTDPKPVSFDQENQKFTSHASSLMQCGQARTCVAGMVLPLNAELEIEAVASLE